VDKHENKQRTNLLRRVVRLDEIEHMIVNSQKEMVSIVEESKRISAILKEEARLKLVAETKHKYCINPL
jgi:uncharacterized small protein (DUF1192 family)